MAVTNWDIYCSMNPWCSDLEDNQIKIVKESLGYQGFLLHIEKERLKDEMLKSFECSFVGRWLNKLMRW